MHFELRAQTRKWRLLVTTSARTMECQGARRVQEPRKLLVGAHLALLDGVAQMASGSLNWFEVLAGERMSAEGGRSAAVIGASLPVAVLSLIQPATFAAVVDGSDSLRVMQMSPLQTTLRITPPSRRRRTRMTICPSSPPMSRRPGCRGRGVAPSSGNEHRVPRTRRAL
jgi:hypothetical protein